MPDTTPALLDAERLEAAVDELTAQLTALPESTFTHRPAPDEWTAAEVVGHMTEMMPYWARVAVAIGTEPGRGFGRAEDDPDRVGAVLAANDVPRAEALAHLRAAAHDAAAAIKTLDANVLQVEGRHPTRGAITVDALLRDLLIEHAEGHTRQALDAATTRSEG